MMTPHGDSPIGNMGGPDWAAKILHASLEIGDTMLFASDAPPNRYGKPGGPGRQECRGGRRIFGELSAGGQVHTDLQETFWAVRFAIFRTALESRG